MVSKNCVCVVKKIISKSHQKSKKKSSFVIKKLNKINVIKLNKYIYPNVNV